MRYHRPFMSCSLAGVARWEASTASSCTCCVRLRAAISCEECRQADGCGLEAWSSNASVGETQVDDNTGVAMYESDDIIRCALRKAQQSQCSTCIHSASSDYVGCYQHGQLNALLQLTQHPKCSNILWRSARPAAPAAALSSPRTDPVASCAAAADAHKLRQVPV